MANRRKNDLPRELTSRDRWVCWRPVKRGKRWTKLPVTPAGVNASSTDPGTWSRFKDVKDARRGFVLGDGVACVDLDHVIVNGVLAPAAAEILALAPKTFVEVSPSGDGLHVWGLLPEARGHRFSKNGVSVEIYSAARYMTVTNRRWNGAPSRLADLSGFVDALMV
jgi:Uncharacterized conserved protein